MDHENNIDIYQYSGLKDYLKSYYTLKRQNLSGQFTLETWSTKLGYSSPRVVAMVMKGQRPPSEELGSKLVTYFNFVGNKKRYLELLRNKAILEFNHKSTGEIDKEIQKINPYNLQLTSVNPLEFEFISEWHNLVIKQLVKLKTFRNNVEWIRKRLKNKISGSKISKSINILLELGHLKKVNNTLQVSHAIETGGTIPSAAIKKHHEQMLERAKESLYQDDMNERFIYGVTTAFNRENIYEAKKMIQEFMNEFDARFSPQDKSGSDVYQLGVQLFPHTSKERNK